MASVSSIIDRACSILPELPRPRAFELLKKVHRELGFLVPEAFSSGTEDVHTISLAPGDKEYTLPESIVQVDSVEIAGKKLYATSMAVLNEREPLWRSKPNGTPSTYYVFGNKGSLKLGFHPTPSAAATALVYGTIVPQLAYSLNVAGGMHSEDPYVFGLVFSASHEFRPSLSAQYYQLYANAVEQARSFARSASEALTQNPVGSSRNEPQPQLPAR